MVKDLSYPFQARNSLMPADHKYFIYLASFFAPLVGYYPCVTSFAFCRRHDAEPEASNSFLFWGASAKAELWKYSPQNQLRFLLSLPFTTNNISSPPAYRGCAFSANPRCWGRSRLLLLTTVPKTVPLPSSASFKIRSNWNRGARSSNGFSFDIRRIAAKPLRSARGLNEQLASLLCSMIPISN